MDEKELKSNNSDEILKSISKIVNSISIPMSYNEIEAFLRESKCPYFNRVLKHYKDFFDIQDYQKRANGRITPNYVLSKKPVYYKSFSYIFDDVKEKNTHPKEFTEQVSDKDAPAKKRIFADILSRKYIVYRELASIYEKHGVDDVTKKINAEIASGIIKYKRGYYFLNEKVGQLLDKSYKEPIIIEAMTKKEKKKFLEAQKKQPVKPMLVQNAPFKQRLDENGDILFRIEFNQKTQMLHYDNGTHEEDTFGWQTVQKDVRDTCLWTAFDMFRDLFGFEFSSANHVLETYRSFECLLFSYAGLIERNTLTIETCVNFLKRNGFIGKLEKIEKTTFDLT